MDLQQATAKMSKSLDSPQGTVLLLDDPATIVRKFKRAVTDSGSDVVYDPATKPGVANLLSILAAATDADPGDLAGKYTQYGPLKTDTAEAVIELLRPVQQRYAELSRDPGTVQEILARGAAKARATAAATMARVRDRLGLPPI
jgi:tryptophanyl-tRNA synthetase